MVAGIVLITTMFGLVVGVQLSDSVTVAVIQNTNHLPGIVFNCQVYHSNVDNHHSETYWSRAGLLTLDYALFDPNLTLGI